MTWARWWTPERLEAAFELRRQRAPWHVIVDRLGATSEAAVKRRYYEALHARRRRLQRQRHAEKIERENRERILEERRSMLPQPQPRDPDPLLSRLLHG